MAAVTDIALPYFLAHPATQAPWPGVVVIHEGNGITTQLLRVCQRLSAAGYAAVAPDLYFRAGGTESGDFTALMGSLDGTQVRRDRRVDPTPEILRRAPSVNFAATSAQRGRPRDARHSVDYNKLFA
jgi:dienelactone hydrolase